MGLDGPKIVVPSSYFISWNAFAPLVASAPGMNVTTTVEFPGSAPDDSGPQTLANLAELPVSENGMIHATVLPDGSREYQIATNCLATKARSRRSSKSSC